jgi:hypothetical protein
LVGEIYRNFVSSAPSGIPPMGTLFINVVIDDNRMEQMFSKTLGNNSASGRKSRRIFESESGSGNRDYVAAEKISRAR